MIQRTFTRDQLLGWGLPHGFAATDEKAAILDQVDMGSGRWESYHQVVFRAPDDGRVYAIDYSQGLTEDQFVEPWEDAVQVVAIQVQSVQRMVAITDWVPVKYAEPLDRRIPTIAELKAQWAANRADDAAAAEDATWD
jgi:hypothetical protein